jgi:hypothetical protein
MGVASAIKSGARYRKLSGAPRSLLGAAQDCELTVEVVDVP